MNKEPVHEITACFMPGGRKWVPIMAITLSEISAGKFKFPYAWKKLVSEFFGLFEVM